MKGGPASVPSILGQNQSLILAQANTGAPRHPIHRRSVGFRIVAEPVVITRIITVPVTIETHAPATRSRKAKRIVGISLIGKVQDHNHVVPSPALVPAMKPNNLVGWVDMVQVHILPAQTAGIIEPVPAQMDKIPIELCDPGKFRRV